MTSSTSPFSPGWLAFELPGYRGCDGHNHGLLFPVLVCVALNVAFGLVACKPQETDLPFEMIEQKESAGTGKLYENREPRLIVISRPEEASNLNEWIADETNKKLQEVDYDQHFALAVFQGWKPSAGYSVEVKRVTQLGNTVNVYVQFHEPKPDEGKADIETSPYQLVKVQKGETMGREFTLNLLADKAVIFSFSYVIP